MGGFIAVTPEVEKALGKTADELSRLTLGRFADLVFSKGYVVRVSGMEDAEPDQGGLTICMTHEDLQKSEAKT
jgi:hypothetical protein